MNAPSHATASSNYALARALVAHPDALNATYHETMVGLMVDLAEGSLACDCEALASKLRDTDAAARNLYELMVTLPAGTPSSTTRSSDSIMGALHATLGEVRDFYQACVPLRNSSLASGANLRSVRKVIKVGDCIATLCLNERASGGFDADISIPAASVPNPDALNGLLLKIIDRPRFLNFVLTNGYYVATQPLPGRIDEPGKDLDIERVDLE